MASTSILTATASIAAKFGQAVNLFQLGRIDAAEVLCREILQSQPAHADALHVLGVAALQKGRAEYGVELIRKSLGINSGQPLAHCNLGNALRDLRQPNEALASYGRALQLAPEFAGALYGQGNVLLDLDRAEGALVSYDRAVALRPDFAEAHQNRGNALLALGRHSEALESYRRALALQPDMSIALDNCALVLRQLRRRDEALAIYDRLSALRPEDAEPLVNRGTLLIELKRDAEAIESFDRALRLRPEAVVAWYNRANARLTLKQFDQALADYDVALRIDANLAEAHCNRGHCLLELDRPEESLESFEKAARLKPEFAEALDGTGIALRALKRYEAALAAFERALAHKSDGPDILYRRAVTLRNLKRHDEAALAFERVLQAAPEYPYALGNLLHERLQSCNWTGYDDTVGKIQQSLRDGKRVYLPGPFLTVSNSADEQLKCARLFVADKLHTEQSLVSSGALSYRHDRIRIAYVSADFRDHPVSQLLTGVLEQHDRRRFETIGISLQPEEHGPLGQRVKRAFDRFIDVSRRSDREVCALLRDLEIDIAVDLMGFSGGGRHAIFALRSAPVQVSYLGFSGTLGAPYMDYLLADRTIIPERDRDSYAEKIAYLPHSFQPNDGNRAIAQRTPTRAECGLPDHGFVFCCFNSHYKIAPAVFDSWMRLLHDVEGSVLWLPEGNEMVVRNLRREAVARGVAPERLLFAARVPDLADHLARLQLADLFLDTLPYNAHTTASDALWAGLPVLTCRGGSFAARVAASLLTALGLPELITSSLSAYEALARELAATATLLGELRARLARNRLTSPLFNTERYCQHLESVYHRMWERSERGEAPESFGVEPLPAS